MSVINGAVTLAVVAPSIWDLNLREGHGDYANWQKNIVKFALRPLAFGAMPLFFLSTFSEHLHDSPGLDATRCIISAGWIDAGLSGYQ